ncbi:MAG: tail sheath stabilizer and completion protein [Actinomycetes bacterium]|jgi:hypothetical protein
MADPFYNRIIRKTVIGFGNLFNNITMVRYNKDETEQERFVIPISYASKELYVKRLQEDPDLDKKVSMNLPRFSFEMNGFSYDASRKQNTNIKNFGIRNNAVISQYNPVPYNFDFSLFLYVRNIEDATQVLEYILSYFTPDYTIKLNLIPEMGITKEIPVILNSTNQQIEYEGDAESPTRLIIWTLNFTVKGFIFGAVSPAGGIIKSAFTSIVDLSPSKVVFAMNPVTENIPYKIGEYVYQGYSPHVATATAKVVAWANNELTLSETNGTFSPSFQIIGIDSNAAYSPLILKNPGTITRASILKTVSPITANVNDPTVIVETFINEFPN